MRPINAPAGDRPVARARHSSSLLREADRFFNIGRKLDRCPRVKIPPTSARLFRLAVTDNQHLMKFRWLALICVFLLLIYGASPYFSFWRFSAALRSGDSAALSSRMDFPAIRASLKKQLVARFAQRTTTHKWLNNLGPTLIDTIIDAYVTPEGIAALISNPEVLKILQRPQQFRFPTGKAEDWSKVKHAFFAGPRTFVVDRQGIKLRFRFTGFGLDALRPRSWSG